jgi:hypothetical protein
MFMAGNIPGMARASNVFLAPGEPTINTLWTKKPYAFQ